MRPAQDINNFVYLSKGKHQCASTTDQQQLKKSFSLGYKLAKSHSF